MQKEIDDFLLIALVTIVIVIILTILTAILLIIFKLILLAILPKERSALNHMGLYSVLILMLIFVLVIWFLAKLISCKYLS
jgi:uncharacterized membrane protein YdbT with pleckstrin-like domain